MAASLFPPQTQIGIHPNKGDEDQVNEHESQGAFGMFVHHCRSSFSESLIESRNARRQSSSVIMPTRVPLSTTGKQPHCRCSSRRVACTMSISGPIHTTSLVMH